MHLQRHINRMCLLSALIGLAGWIGTDSTQAEEWRAPNDDFANPYRLPGGARSLRRAVQLYQGTAEPGEPPYHGRPVLESVWLRWTPTHSGLVELGASEAGAAVKLDVFEGDRLTALSPVVANRVVPGMRGPAGTVLFRALAGRTYSIRLQDVGAIVPLLAYGIVRLQYLPEESAVVWQEHQLLLSQRGSFSVHPALLSPAARRQFDNFWRAGSSPRRGSFNGYRGRTTYGGLRVSIILTQGEFISFTNDAATASFPP